MSSERTIFEDVFYKDVVKGFDRTASKDLEKSYLSRDLPRLVHKTSIFVEEDEKLVEIPVEQFEEDENNKKRLFLFLDALTDVMNQDEGMSKIPKLELEDWNKNVSVSSCQLFSAFIQKFYGEECRMMKLLKMVEQGVVINFLNNFHVQTFMKYKLRMKDVRGEWDVIIEKRNTPFPTYGILHRRTEQVTTSQLQEIFQFTWEIKFLFDSREVNHIRCIKAKILNLKWNNEEERDEEIEKNFVSFFGNPEVIDKIPSVEEEDVTPKRVVAKRAIPKRAKQEEEESSDDDDDSEEEEEGEGDEFAQIEREIKKAIQETESGTGWMVAILTLMVLLFGVIVWSCSQ